MFEFPQRAFRMRSEQFSGLSKHDLPTEAVEQPGAKLLFKRHDLD
jgi:hypothetical protein